MPSSSASTFFSASMIRASSPPEATFWMGLSASPTLADMRNCTSSMPVSSSPGLPPWGRTPPGTRTLGISSWRSSSCTRAWRACGRLPAGPGRAPAPAFGRLLRGLLQLLLQLRAMVSSAYWIWSSSWPAPLQIGQHLLHRGAVLLSQPVDQVQPAPPAGPAPRGEVQALRSGPAAVSAASSGLTAQLGELLGQLGRAALAGTGPPPWTAPSACRKQGDSAPARPRPRTGQIRALLNGLHQLSGAAQQRSAGPSAPRPPRASARPAPARRSGRCRVSTRRDRLRLVHLQRRDLPADAAQAVVGLADRLPAAPPVSPKRSR